MFISQSPKMVKSSNSPQHWPVQELLLLISFLPPSHLTHGTPSWLKVDLEESQVTDTWGGKFMPKD